MNALSRPHLPHPTPLHVKLRASEALARRGIWGTAVDDALREACAICNAEHQAAKEAAA